MFTIRRATTAVGAAALIALAATGCGGTKFAAPSQTLPATPGAHLTKAPQSTTAPTTRTAVSTNRASTSSSQPSATTPTTRTPVTAAPTTVAPTTPASAAPASTALPLINLADFHGIKPTQITFAMDGTNVASGLVWSSWTTTSAEATGTEEIDDCVPDCADSPPKDAPVDITLTGVSGGQFTELTETGPLLSDTFTLPSGVLYTN